MSSGQESLLENYLDSEEQRQVGIPSGSVRELATWIRKHPKPLGLGIVMIFVGTAAAIAEPFLFGHAIDEAIIPGNWDLLRKFSIFYLLIISVRVTAAISQSYFFEQVGQRVTQDLRCALFSHLQRQPMSVFDKNPAGRLLTRVTNDVASLSEMFSAGFVAILGNILLVAGILVMLLVINVKLGLIAAAFLPFLIYASVYFSGRLKIAYREARSKLSALNAFLAENILGMKVVNLFNRQALHLERFERINQWHADAQIASTRVFALFQPTITWVSGISVALVIWFGGRMAQGGVLKVGVLFAFFSYVLSFFQPVREIADKWNVFLSGMASAERIFSIFRWKPEMTSLEPIEKLGLRGEIVFENVWFAYEAEHWVLKDFSLRICAGERVGVVGHTGAGKTTLISLLMRFYEPQRGRILIDGKDLREIDRRSLRAAIGIVQQDVFLFSGSVQDNIGFWDTKEMPHLRADLAALGFARELELEERGTNLSVGEKQILAFARALVRHPSIWILDEATANMDSQTEAKLERSLKVSAQGKTTILIAHRLSTVRDADQILVLHKGSLVEQGSHDSLMKLSGLYARLYRYQQSQQNGVTRKPEPLISL